jgi:hypothetical protein
MSGSTKVAATPADNIAPAFNMGLCGLSVEENIEAVNFYILSSLETTKVIKSKN